MIFYFPSEFFNGMEDFVSRVFEMLMLIVLWTNKDLCSRHRINIRREAITTNLTEGQLILVAQEEQSVLHLFQRFRIQLCLAIQSYPNGFHFRYCQRLEVRNPIRIHDFMGIHCIHQIIFNDIVNISILFAHFD